MKLSCALVLTLTNLVIATPFSFSVKGSGASAKAEAATSPFGQLGVVKPVASKTSGFSGSFSKSSAASFASSSASSSSSAYNYNAGQIGTASLGYGSQGLLLPNKNVGPQVVTVPQATGFATAGSNSQTGASVNAQASGSYYSEKGDVFSGNANSPANAQYQSAVQADQPNSYVGLSSGVPNNWQEQSKPNSYNTYVPEHPEKVKETFGVQSFSSNLQSGTAFPSASSAPSQGSASVENAPSYSSGFGGPPGILYPQDKITTVGSTPSYNAYPSYPSGAQLNVPNKQQFSVNIPVSTVNPSSVQQDYLTGNINPTIQSINNEYQSSKPTYKPDIKPSYFEQNKPTASSSYPASSEWQQNSGQYDTLQPQAEITHTHKELEQAHHSISQFSPQSDKPFANGHNSKPIKNIQIFIQPLSSNAAQSSSIPVHSTNTEIDSQNEKEVKPTTQYTGGFGAPAGILKPSGQYASSGQTFSSSPVKGEQYDSLPVGLTSTGVKETASNTAFVGLLNEGKVTAQSSLQSSNDYSIDSGSSSETYVTPKPSTSSLFASSPLEQVSNDYVSTEQKGVDPFSGKPSQNGFLNPTVSSWTQNPTVNSLPKRPETEVENKPSSQNFFSTPSSPQYPEQGLGGVSISVDKTKQPTLSGSFGQVSEDLKPTIQSTIANNGFAYSNTPYKPVVTPTTPQFEGTKQKEPSFVSFSTTQATPVNSWQQSTYKPSFQGSTPEYFDSQKTSPTKYPSLTGDYTISKQNDQYPSNVGSTPVDFQVNSNQQSSNYGSTAASFIAQEPAAQVNFANPTLTSFSQGSTPKPSIGNSVSQFPESPKTSPPQSFSPGTYTVSKEVYKVPTQIVSTNVYPTGSVASVFDLTPNSEQSQYQTTSQQNQQSTNYGGTTSFVTQKPTTINFNAQSVDASSKLTSASVTQQPNKPAVANSQATSSVSGSYVSSIVSPTQKPFYTESYNVPKETEIIPSDSSSNVDSTVGTAPVHGLNNPNVISGKPQTQFGVSQQSVEYKPTSSFVTKEPTNYSNLASQAISGTSAISQSTTFSQQSQNKPTVGNSEGSSPVSGLPETTPSKNTQYQFPTKPTVVTGPQKQPVYSNVFGTGAVKPSRFPSPSSTGYPSSSGNPWSGPVYLTGSFDKSKQTTYFNQNKPAASSSQDKKETTNPTNQPYFTGSSNFASNIPTTSKPSVSVASLNVAQQTKPSVSVASLSVAQQSTSSITNQKQKESTATATSGFGSTYSKPTAQPILSNSGVSYTSFASPNPTKPTNQFSTSNSAFPSFASSSFSQVKPQYQFSTIQPVPQKKQWYTNNYGTFGSIKPHSYPGFTSSFTTFGQGSVGGLYDKTKQTTSTTSQYTSTGQYKPTLTTQYNPSLTGQYKPGQYKPTYNWGITGQSQFQKPSQPQTGGSYVSTYPQSNSKPFVTPSSSDKQKPTGGAFIVNQKESIIPSSFATSTVVAKPTNQPSASKPISSGTSLESGTGSSSLTSVSDKEKVTSSVVSTTSYYDQQKPVKPTIQTVTNTYVTPSFITAKPTVVFQSTETPFLENKPTYSYTVQQQIVPSVQTVTPTKDIENFELGQSIKPFSSSSNQKETSYTSNTGVATSNSNPTTVVSSDNSYFVDKTQITSSVKPTSSVNFVGQTISSVGTASTNNKFPYVTSSSIGNQKPLNQFIGQVDSLNQQSAEQFSSTVNKGNTESYLSNSQAQPTPIKPQISSSFGESSVQSTPPKQASSNLEASYGQIESAQHVHNEHVHSKPANTLIISTSQPHAVGSTGSATTQFSKIPSVASFISKPENVQYTSQNAQAAYKPPSLAGSITGFANQQSANPTVTVPPQENYSNVVNGPIKPPGQYWAVNSQQSTVQQTAFQATKPNEKITVVGKPVSNIDSSPYSGGFGGPSGILKPNEFGISSSQGNFQSQFQATSGAYSSAKVETDPNTSSYSGGFGAPSGVLKPDEKHGVHHAGHNKPEYNGFYFGQDGAQASYHVNPQFPSHGVQQFIKEQTGSGAQASSGVQGTAVTNVVASATPNAAANASGYANNNANASSAGVEKTGTTFGGQFGINGFSANAKGSATASTGSSGLGGSLTSFNPPRLSGSPGYIATILG